jgi:hypothetical protein
VTAFALLGRADARKYEHCCFLSPATAMVIYLAHSLSFSFSQAKKLLSLQTSNASKMSAFQAACVKREPGITFVTDGIPITNYTTQNWGTQKVLEHENHVVEQGLISADSILFWKGEEQSNTDWMTIFKI